MNYYIKTKLLLTLSLIIIFSQNAYALTTSKIFVRQFQLVGNTVFSTTELKSLIEDYENREITTLELQEVKDNLTQYYEDHGYHNAGAVIIDQKVENDTIILEIIEGHLLNKNSIGNEQLRDYAITKRMQILPQNPWCEPIATRLRPTFQGKQIRLTESRPYLINFNFNNHNSPTYGANQGEISLIHHNLTGFNDVVNLCYGHSSGSDNYSVNYAIPVFNRDTMLAIGFGSRKDSVEEYPFSLLNIKHETENLSVSLRHLFYKTDQQYLLFFSTLQTLNSQSFLGPEISMPFSPGVDEDGKSNITVLSVGSEWFYLNSQRIIRPYLSLNFGLDAFDSTINENLPDSEFFMLSTGLNWTERLQTLNSQLFFSAEIQYSDEDLLSNAKPRLGGIETVRGYRENHFARDRIFQASFDWQIPITQLRIPTLSKVPGDGMVYLVPFIDYGWGQNVEIDTPKPKDISSIGLGLRWFPTETIQAEVFWGKRLRSVNDPAEHDLQDEGIHFELSFQIY